jgi:hypothetical protein
LISGLRGVGCCWTEYKAILDKTLHCIVWAHKYKKNRLIIPLSQWFTFTYEAFLLVCLELNRRKWTYEYTKELGTPEEKAALPAEAPGPLYTGRLQGMKRGWKNVGIERFNQLMVKVARGDCKANAHLADQNFLQYQIFFFHGPRQAAVAEVEDAPPQPQLMEHATANNNVNDSENNHDDNEDDSEEESVEMEPV